MTIDEIDAQVKIDLQIDNTQLDIESCRTPEIHNKYMRMLAEAIKLLRAYELKEKLVKKQVWEFYSGKATAKEYAQKNFQLKVLKCDVPIYLESDEKYQGIKASIDMQTIIVNYLEQIIKQINNRNWLIRNIIEFKKFTNGVS